VYNHPDEGNVSTRDLEHVASLQLHYDSPRVGLRADLSGGIGYLGQPDLVGLALMPFVHLGETVMLVGRYTWLHSFGDDGIRFNRYDSRIEAGRGDRYHELFVGLNWLLYGDRFKVQTGLTWTRMRDRPADGGDYEGWGWTTGVRMSW
jgi:phosphate-selective porin OprO/OprP